MPAEQSQRVGQLLREALKRDATERAAFLSEACAGDETLRQSVESLLRTTPAARNVTTPPTALNDDDRLRWLHATADVAPPVASADPEAPGTMLDRYVLLGLLGSGGMGVVYAAYDPELDRRVAIKLLRPGSLNPEQGRARLLREAQAMARLSHPNVIAVYHVGTYREQVFMVMEHVEGGTLRRWLSKEPRTVDQIVSVFLQAGRGLAAAHAAGLLHRDFKPDNVLLGKDGRARVIDFGLARAIEDDATPTASSTTEPGESTDSAATGQLALSLTSTGALIGTPAYMAPEQRMGLEADARTDQFSFCVALYEALYRERPFSAPDLKTPWSEKNQIEVKEPPRSSGVSVRLRRAIMRGLQLVPAERYPSMDALLEQLDRKSIIAQRSTVTVGAVLLLSTAGALAYWQLAHKQSQLCKGAERNLAGVWDNERKSAVARAFRALGKPYGEDAVNGVERTLDTYAQNWVKMHTEACEATRIRRVQSGELLDRRMACLSQRREELKALSELFSRADTKLLTKAVEAAQSLTPLHGCADEKTLMAPLRPPADAATRAKVDEAQNKIAAAIAYDEAGRYAEALPIVTAVVAEAKELGYRPLEAQALRWLGIFQDLTGDTKAAEQTLKSALHAASAEGYDLILAQAWSDLLALYNKLARYSEGEEAAKHTFAAIERLGGNDEFFSSTLNNVGIILERQAKYAEALDHFQRALEINKRIFGQVNRHVAGSLSNLGVVQARLGREDAALESYRGALSIYEQTLGPRHPRLSLSLNNIGNILRRQDKLAESRAHYERAIAIVEAAEGPNAFDIALPLDNLGIVLRRELKLDEALALHRRALDIRLRTLGEAHPDVGSTLEHIGQVLLDQKKPREALAYFERELRINEKVLGGQHPYIGYDLARIGRTYLDLHQAKNAIAPLERALRVFEARPDRLKNLAEARFVLARALETSGRDRKRARSVALQAREFYATDVEKNAKPLAEIDAWLARKRQH